MKETTHRGWYILEQREGSIVAFPRVQTVERVLILQEAWLRQSCKSMAAWAQKGGRGNGMSREIFLDLYLPQGSPKPLGVHEEKDQECPPSRT